MTSIRKSLVSGIFYTALAKYSGIFISIFIGAILARLLTPEEFGTVALVTVFVTFFALLSDFGIGPAVVQNNNLEKEDIESIFSFSVLIGIVLTGLFFMGSGLIAKFYKNDELINVSRLLSLSLLLNSLNIVPRALYQKALKFKQIGIISVLVHMFCGIIAIILAYSGLSYYALVIQSIMSSGISLIIYLIIAPVRIGAKMSIKSIKKIFKFSSFQFMFNFINYFSRNSDNILIGKFFSPSALGYYDKSYRLMMMPVSNLTHVITPVLMPVLSKHQDNTDVVYNAYLKVVRLLATIGFPLSVFLFFSANEIVNLLYGPQWGPSVPVFRLLALTVGIQIILSSSGSIFQVVNRTDLLFYSGLLSSIFMVGGITAGIFIGKSIESVGFGLIIAFCVNFFQGFFMLIKMALKKPMINFLRTIVLPVLVSILMTVALSVFSLYEGDQLGYSLIIKILISVLIFSGSFLSIKRYRQVVWSSLTNSVK